MLGILPGIILHVVTVVVLALGLSGLSVGLGGLPNFRETDPSKIAVGFGGTLNLILELILLVLVVGLDRRTMNFPTPTTRAKSSSRSRSRNGGSTSASPWGWPWGRAPSSCPCASGPTI